MVEWVVVCFGVVMIMSSSGDSKRVGGWLSGGSFFTCAHVPRARGIGEKDREKWDMI